MLPAWHCFTTHISRKMLAMDNKANALELAQDLSEQDAKSEYKGLQNMCTYMRTCIHTDMHTQCFWCPPNQKHLEGISLLNLTSNRHTHLHQYSAQSYNDVRPDLSSTRVTKDWPGTRCKPSCSLQQASSVWPMAERCNSPAARGGLPPRVIWGPGRLHSPPLCVCENVYIPIWRSPNSVC